MNANIAMVTGFSCHEDPEEARSRGMDGFRFFGYSLGHFYVFGNHRPGRTNVWDRFEAARDELPEVGSGSGIGAPDDLSDHLAKFEAAGVDQVIFIQQGGRNRHEDICASLELFASRVMPGFHAHEEEREARKRAELAPYLEAAMARKPVFAPARRGPYPDHHPPRAEHRADGRAGRRGRDPAHPRRHHGAARGPARAPRVRGLAGSGGAGGIGRAAFARSASIRSRALAAWPKPDDRLRTRAAGERAAVAMTPARG